MLSAMNKKEHPWQGSLEEGYPEGESVAHEAASSDLSPEEVTILKNLRQKKHINAEELERLNEWELQEKDPVISESRPQIKDHDEKSEEAVKSALTEESETPEDGGTPTDTETNSEKKLRQEEKMRAYMEHINFPSSYRTGKIRKGASPINQRRVPHKPFGPTVFIKVESGGKHMPKKPWSQKGAETIRKPPTE